MKKLELNKLDANRLFYCKVYDPDLDYDTNAVVYQVGEIYYDMRQITNILDLTAIGRLFCPLYYFKDEVSKPSFYYHKRCVLIGSSLEKYYGQNKRTFTVKELINDMIEDDRIDTGSPYYTEYAEKRKSRL